MTPREGMVRRERRRTWLVVALVVTLVVGVPLGFNLVFWLLKPRDAAVDRAREAVGAVARRVEDALEGAAGQPDYGRLGAAQEAIGQDYSSQGQFRSPVTNDDGTTSYFVYVVGNESTAGGLVGFSATALVCAEMVVDVRGEGSVHLRNADCTDEVRHRADADVEADFSS